MSRALNGTLIVAGSLATTLDNQRALVGLATKAIHTVDAHTAMRKAEGRRGRRLLHRAASCAHESGFSRTEQVPLLLFLQLHKQTQLKEVTPVRRERARSMQNIIDGAC